MYAKYSYKMWEKLLQHWAKLSCLEEDCQTMLEVKNLTRAITLAYQYKTEMKTLLLTVGTIQDFHKEVLKQCFPTFFLHAPLFNNRISCAPSNLRR